MEKGKLKGRVILENIPHISLSKKVDNVLVFHCTNEKKGDWWIVTNDAVTLVIFFFFFFL